MYEREPEYKTLEKIRYVCDMYRLSIPSSLRSSYGQALCKVLDHMSLHGSPNTIEVRTSSIYYTSSYQTYEMRMTYLDGRQVVVSYMDDYINPQSYTPAPTLPKSLEPSVKEAKVNKLLLLL